MKKPLNLFNDVEDEHTRNHNRAAIMANLFEDNVKQGKRTTSAKGASYIMAYFTCIPKADRKNVQVMYQEIMSKRQQPLGER